MLEFESDKSSLYLLADKTDHCWGALVVAATTSLVTGVILWITVAVVVSNPPNGSKLNSMSQYILAPLSHFIMCLTNNYELSRGPQTLLVCSQCE